MIPLAVMEISKAREVRILGLGDEGSRALPSLARAVVDMWSDGAVIRLESLCAGDDELLASRSIRRWCDRDQVDVVFTVGRSGHERADFAPEMTAGLLDRALPGVEERMYLASARGRYDLLFRGRAGMRRGTLVVNLPARPARARAIVRFLGPVVGHAVEKARGSDRECLPTGVPR
jgi:molybdopterin biosynthesis enzyme MoaB